MAPSPTSSRPPSFFSSPTRKRFQKSSVAPHLPVLFLDRHGTIESLTDGARRLLEYSSDAALDPCFFSHVHRSNQHRVMRDLADMVCRGKQRAQWLLRLRTGKKRWRWYRASVEHDPSNDTIRVQLRPL